MIDGRAFHEALDASLQQPGRLDVLDAGCGTRFPFKLKQPAHITGIDISPESMNRSNHLDEYLVGDIQEHRFDAKFDLVVCMNVLEHLPNPERAISNLTSALRASGVIVLGFPNPLSMKGLATKFTPHFVHVFVLKRFLNYSKAGQKGYAPFPTYLRFALAAKSVARRLKESGLDVVFVREFEGNQPLKLREKSSILYALYRLACATTDILSLGALKSNLSETLVIARRKWR